MPDPQPDEHKIDRLLRLVLLVQGPSRWTADGLAEEFGVSQRSVYRYIDTLQKAGIPIEFDRAAGGYRIRGDFYLPPVHLAAEEALALATLCEGVARSGQVPFLAPAARALAKIAATLPDELRDEIDEITDSMIVRTAQANDAEGYQDVYETVRVAIRDRRALVCRYDAAHGRGDGSEEFDFEPYALFFSVRAWYAVGWHGGRDALRTLKLRRFSKITPTARRFRIPEDFSLERHLGNAWQMIRGEPEYDVELVFDAEFAETVADTQWHRTQEIEERADGSLHFRCTVSGLDEIVWWVLSMGPHCRVLQPAALREQVRGLAQAIVDQADAPA